MFIYSPHITGQGVDMFGGGASLAGNQLSVYAVTTSQLKKGLTYDVSGLLSPSGPPVNYPKAVFQGPSGGPAVALFQVG